MGLPIIVIPCGGSKELVQRNGFIVVIDQFVDTMIMMCNNKQYCIDMRRKSEILARAQFEWREKAEAYLKIFEKSGQ